MHVIVFSGQSAKNASAGSRLFDDVPQFREIEDNADLIVGYTARELSLKNSDRLNRTCYTRGCPYVVNALSNMDAIRCGVGGDCFARHSLGEFNALLVVDCFDLLDGLELIRKREELIARAQGGGVLAVLDLPIEEGERVLKRP